MPTRRLLWMIVVIAILALAYFLVPRDRPGEQQSNGTPPNAAPLSHRAANARPAVPHLSVSPAAVRPSPNASFSGHVVSRTTGVGIDRAELTFGRDQASHSVMSGAGGAFHFEPPEPGTYQLAAASAEGFQPFLPEWGDSPLVLTARPGTAMSDLLIQLAEQKADPGPGAAAPAAQESPASERLSITGRVVDAGGDGLAAVPITARRAGAGPFDNALGQTGRSDAEGGFVLPELAPGKYTLTATSPGLVTARLEDVPAGSQDVVLRLSEAGGMIAGRVTTDQGKPVPSFAVVISQAAGKLAEHPVQTTSFLDAEGRFLLGPFAAGEYRVRAVAARYAPSDKAEVTAVVGKTVNAELRLSGGGTLVGSVLDAKTAAAVDGARISLEGQLVDDALPIPLETSVLSEANGHFELGGIPAGLCSVGASARGYNTRLLSGLQLSEGATLGPVEIPLTPLASPDAAPKTELTGIGAQLAPDGDVLVVGKIFAGGGAAEAGLVPGDRILAIDGQVVGELDFNGVIQRIRGPEGTSVVLTVRRQSGKEQTLAIVRRLVRG